MKDKKMTKNGRKQDGNMHQKPQKRMNGTVRSKSLKLGSVLLTVMMMMTLLGSSLFATVWDQYALDPSNNAVVAFETPVSEQEASLIYKTRVRTESSYDAISNILLAEGYAYVATGRSLLKISADGEIAAEAELTAPLHPWTPSIAYGNNHIYAFVEADGKGYIEAVDATSMSTSWTSTSIDEYQAFSALTISDGMLYIPVSLYNYSTYSPQGPGKILALDTRTSEDEPLLQVLYTDDDAAFYGNKPALTEQYIYIGSQEGDLLAINRENGTLAAKAATGQSIKSAVTLAGQFLYFGTESGVGRIGLDENGHFITDRLQLVDLGIQSTATPVIYQDMLYAGTGNFGGGKGMYVIDTRSMEILFTAETSGFDSWTGDFQETAGIQSSPVLTTAYDDAVYLYYTINAMPSSLLMLTYETGSDSSEAVEIFVPDEADQNASMSTIVADEQGVLYYTNDAGYLFAVGKAQVTEEPEETEETEEAEETETGETEDADKTERETIPPTGSLAGPYLAILIMLALLSLSLSAALILSGRKQNHNR